MSASAPRRLPQSDISLNAGDLYFGSEPVRVRTVLGTCVAITLWHPLKRIGGICHFMLPKRGGSDQVMRASAGFYADEVMHLFAASLASSKTKPAEYVVKVFGGGNMFPDYLQNLACREQNCTDVLRMHCPNVGCQNIGAARRLLAANNYAISFEHVGGHGSRQLVFDVGSGDVWVRRGAAMNSAGEGNT